MKYKFNDLGKKLGLVQKHCNEINALADLKATQGQHVPRVEVDKALNACKRKHDRYYGNTSKYTPHQGHKEQARRRRGS